MDDQISQDSENLTVETCLDETDTDNVRFNSNVEWVWPAQQPVSYINIYIAKNLSKV